MEIRRGEHNAWHIAAQVGGVYIRLYPAGEAVVLTTDVAREIATAILEVTDVRSQ
jgi:hypothetical protein